MLKKIYVIPSSCIASLTQDLIFTFLYIFKSGTQILSFFWSACVAHTDKPRIQEQAVLKNNVCYFQTEPEQGENEWFPGVVYKLKKT